MDDLWNHRTVPEYNTRAVEKRTGVPADTFRAWERRHGLPAPARTDGNRRLYSEQDIALICWLKAMTADGVSISQAVSMARRQSARAQVTLDPMRTPDPALHPELERYRACLIEAFSRFDAHQANALIEEALALHDPETVCLDIMAPALTMLGALRERGERCLAVERFGVAFCMHRISALFNASRPEIGDPTIIAGCVEGEQHEIGLLLTSLLLSRSGWRMIYLGANLPGCELHEAVRRVNPQAIMLAATTLDRVDCLTTTIATLHARMPSSTCPVIGYEGAIFESRAELRDTVDACYLGSDARRARDILQQALRPRSEKMVPTAT